MQQYMKREDPNIIVTPITWQDLNMQQIFYLITMPASSPSNFGFVKVFHFISVFSLCKIFF